MTNNEKLNLAFDIPLEQIEENIHLKINGDLSGYDRIVPPRALVSVQEMCYMKINIFEALIRNIPLRREGEKIYPYQNSNIRLFRREPAGFEIGQKFVLEKKILSMMKSFEDKLFSGFCSPGIAKMPPIHFYGLDEYGEKAMAFYIPPIAEIQGREVVLIDGIHRTFLCKSTGTTINAVHINHVSQPLPFDPISWKETYLVSEKPPKNERYKNLRIEYFRDLGAIGIDG